jgi:tetratricopeptide (TPR) repeat protein
MRFLRAFAGAAAAAALISCATPSGTFVRAEEYFSIASAYFDLGKYPEAARWFNLARKNKKTEKAAEYYLGRVDFMLGDYESSALRFERLLEDDPSNATVIRAAAYARLKAREWDKALELFSRLEALLPETPDARYNYALALSLAGRYEESIDKLKPYAERNPSERDALLLLGRAERKLGRPEAMDRFSAALALKEEGAVRLELAELFEERQLFARSLESYDLLLGSESGVADGIGKADLRFRKARVLLIAGEDPAQGLAELRSAVKEGFKDSALLAGLSEDPRLSEDIRRSVSEIAGGLERAAAPESSTDQR